MSSLCARARVAAAGLLLMGTSLSSITAPSPSLAGAEVPFAAAQAPPGPLQGIGAANFAATEPARLADTRPGFLTADGQIAGGGATTLLMVPVAGRVGVPADAASVSVNVTVTETTEAGFVTVYPCDQERPFASNLNYEPGTTVANAVTARLGNGALCLFATSAVQLVVDLSGWFGPGGTLVAQSPARVADTRPGSFTADGAGSGAGPLQTLEIPVAGRVGVPADAVAVLVNVTVTAPAGAGFVTVFPCGAPFPLASNLNFVAAQTVPNLVLAAIGTGGAICAYSAVPTHLVVDVTGFVPAGSDLAPTSPKRLLDSRVPGFATFDGAMAGVGKPRGGVYLSLPVTGRAGIPANAAAVLLNVTVTEAEGHNFVTAFPCGAGRPNASNVNSGPGATVPNLVLARVGAGGEVCLFTAARSHLVVDVAGWLPAVTAPPAPAGPTMLAGCPVFPADNAWNTDISAHPVRAESAGWVNAVGIRNLHPDFGANPAYGIPFTVVGPGEPAVPVTFVDYGDESDPGPYPVPLDAPIEGGVNASGDRHVLALQQDSCRLHELFNARPDPAGGWTASSGAIFDLRSNAQRPNGWTSADAAGLPILPGLVRYDEVRRGAITHALRFTVPSTQRGFIWPATHFAGNTPTSPPMGARFRLKASFDVSGYHGDARVILEALKKYGMIVADNGTGWYISGATDPRWNDTDIGQLKTVPGSAFEVVDTGPVRTA